MIFASIILIGLSAFISSFLFVLGFRKIAPKLGLIDESGREKRKDHHGHPALVGGAAITLAVVFASFIWFSGFQLETLISLILGMGLYFLLGIFDDAFNIPALSKLFLQILIATGIIFFFDFALHNLGHLYGGDDIFSLGDLAPAFTLMCILIYINAFNMIDGLDGLSGGVALVTLIFMGLISIIGGLVVMQDLIIILSMATLGFLVLNIRSPLRRKALVFLGDSGSLSLSFALAWCAIYMGNEYSANYNLPAPITYAFILAYPIFDMLIVMMSRFNKGLSIFAPDTNHLHHLLKRKGISIGNISALLIGLSGSYGLVGLILWQADIQQNISLLIWFLLLAVHYGFYRLAEAKK